MRQAILLLSVAIGLALPSSAAGAVERTASDEMPGPVRLPLNDLDEGSRVLLGGRDFEAVIPEPDALTTTLRIYDDAGTLASLRRFVGPDEGGRVSGLWDPQDGPRLRAGHRLELDWGQGDPWVWTLPDLRVTADAELERLVGRAPPGMRLYEAAEPDGPTTGPYVTDVDGRFEIDLSGREDLGPGAAGLVFVDLSGGHRVYLPWNLPSVEIDLSTDHASGTCPPSHDVTLAVLSQEGELLDRRGLPCGAGLAASSRWRWDWRDSFGLPSPARGGSFLEVRVGRQAPLRVEIPRVSAQVDVEADRFLGKVDPPAPALVRLSRSGESHEFQPLGWPDGDLAQDFSADWDARLGDHDARLSLSYAALEVETRVALPRLRIDLDSGAFEGALADAERATLRLAEAGRTLHEVLLAPDSAGRFTGALRDVDGDVLRLSPGMSLALMSPAGLRPQRHGYLIPAFTMHAQAPPPQLAGHATPGGALRFLASTDYRDPGPGLSGRVEPMISAEGRYEASFAPPLAFLPGQEIRGTYAGADGLEATRSSFVTMLSVQLDGNQVCGRTDRRGEIAAAWRQGPAADWTALAPGEVRPDGSFALSLAHPDGSDLQLSAGAALRMEAGGELLGELVLPELELAVDWPAMQLRGRLPAGAVGEMRGPLQGCQDERRLVAGATESLRADEEGRFQVFVSRYRGEPRQISLLLANGHRVYQEITRHRVRAYLEEDRLIGEASPGATLRAEHLDARGERRASGEAVATSDGRFLLRLRDDSGAPYRLPAEGQVVVTEGNDRSELALRPLSFDVSERTGLVGVGPADGALHLELELQDGRLMEHELRTDAQGIFRLGPADLPREIDGGFAGIARIVAILRNYEGNEIASEARLAAAPDAPGSRIWLPHALRGR